MKDESKRKLSEPTLLNINLKKAREERGETQTDVAINLGMKDNKMISWYENTGAMPPYNKLVALAKYYDKSMDDLFGTNTGLRQETIICQKKATFAIIRTGNLEERGFFVKSDLKNFTKERAITIKTLLENPYLIDSVSELLEYNQLKK